MKIKLEVCNTSSHGRRLQGFAKLKHLVLVDRLTVFEHERRQERINLVKIKSGEAGLRFTSPHVETDVRPEAPGRKLVQHLFHGNLFELIIQLVILRHVCLEPLKEILELHEVQLPCKGLPFDGALFKAFAIILDDIVQIIVQRADILVPHKLPGLRNWVVSATETGKVQGH